MTGKHVRVSVGVVGTGRNRNGIGDVVVPRNSSRDLKPGLETETSEIRDFLEFRILNLCILKDFGLRKKKWLQL
jgi:hypothetical protein